MSRLVPLLLVALVAGCDAKPMGTASKSLRVAKEAPAAAAPGAPPVAGAKADEAQAAERKIIYSATIELAVTNVEAVQPEVEKVVEEFKGYVAKSDITGQVGRSRSATWTLKVPVASYRAAVARLVALGQPLRNSSDSQDVTEEFFDLTARVKNFKAEEETLNKLLKDTAVRLDDILKIREQIKVVRGEIERAEGRLKYLSTMASLSTITLTAREDMPYAPETPAAAATFGEQVSTRFQSSWNSLVGSVKAFALWLVEIALFLPFYAAAAGLAYLVARRVWRTVKAQPVGGRKSPRTPGDDAPGTRQIS